MLPFPRNQKTQTSEKFIDEFQHPAPTSTAVPGPLVMTNIRQLPYIYLVPALANKVYEDVFPVIVRPKSEAQDLDETTEFALNRLTGSKLNILFNPSYLFLKINEMQTFATFAAVIWTRI